MAWCRFSDAATSDEAYIDERERREARDHGRLQLGVVLVTISEQGE